MDQGQKFLPDKFSDLERYCPDWMLDSEKERYRFRVNQTMEELDEFYKAVFPLMDDLAEYIDQYEINAMPAKAMALLRLGQMHVTSFVDSKNAVPVPKRFPILTFSSQNAVSPTLYGG